MQFIQLLTVLSVNQASISRLSQ